MANESELHSNDRVSRGPRAASCRGASVLVVGIVPTLTWSVTRCLLLAGAKPVVLGWHPWSPLQLVPGCRYIPMRAVRWIDGQLDPALMAQIDEAARVSQVEVVLGVDFPSIELLSSHARALTSAPLCPVPNADTMRALHDKAHFSRVVAELGLPQPKTELARSRAELEATSLEFPIITKPTDRWAGVGFRIHRTRQELTACMKAQQLGAEFPLLVQEFVDGKDVGFAFIAQRGQLVAHAAFDQPRRGARRYFDAPALCAHVAKLIEHAKYDGVGEIDTRLDEATGEYRLLEINPRFWASVLYAARAGLNFPELLVMSSPRTYNATSSDIVSLSPYELAIGRTVRFAEDARNAWEHMRPAVSLQSIKALWRRSAW